MLQESFLLCNKYNIPKLSILTLSLYGVLLLQKNMHSGSHAIFQIKNILIPFYASICCSLCIYTSMRKDPVQGKAMEVHTAPFTQCEIHTKSEKSDTRPM